MKEKHSGKNAMLHLAAAAACGIGCAITNLRYPDFIVVQVPTYL
jgi:hypothetical protein